ncbi:MAG TPA: hypothetical protein VMU61_06015 [Candidatus Aquilonibacter sp.]|nr:hypothetical protein [Candidatus Aquilonibacter sp.]
MVRGILLVLLLELYPCFLQGQDLPNAPIPIETWTTFGVFGGEVVADGVTTRVLYQRHYPETDPLARPFVRAGVAGQVGGAVLGMAATGSVWYILRRTHHDRAAKWFLRSVTLGEGCNVTRQFAILSQSRK